MISPTALLQPILPMVSTFLPPATAAGDIAAQFGISPVSTAQVKAFAARNLYELFLHDLSALVSGACQANQAAHELFGCIPPGQIALRRLTLGLAKASRACLPHLPSMLAEEGLVLPPVHDTAVCALLETIHPEIYGKEFEDWCVVGARTTGVFSKIARHLEAQAVDAAENAALLGSDSLRFAFGRWAAVWGDYILEIRAREPGFRAQAYAAGVISRPTWQTA